MEAGPGLPGESYSTAETVLVFQNFVVYDGELRMLRLEDRLQILQTHVSNRIACQMPKIHTASFMLFGKFDRYKFVLSGLASVFRRSLWPT